MLADGEHDRLGEARTTPDLADSLDSPLGRLVFADLVVERDPMPGLRSTMKRALLVASAGGHWIELCRLGAAFREWDCQYVSTASGIKAPLGERPVLQISDSSRDDLGTMLFSIAQLRRIIRDFRPQLVISTGAAPGALALLLAKLHGARTIWIDSIANSEELSLSGRAVKPIADLRLTQWPHLADPAKGVQYFGQVL